MPRIEISDEDLAFLKDLSHEIKTQDNAITAHPYFITVRTSRFIIVPPGHGRGGPVFLDLGSDEPQTYPSKEAFAKALAKEGNTYDEDLRRISELEEYGSEIVYDHHNVFFTRKGYEKHMRLNEHNYQSEVAPHPYVMHAFRNPEIKRLLEIVHRLGGIDGSGDAGTPDTSSPRPEAL